MPKQPLRYQRPAAPTPPPEKPIEPCYCCGGADWWLLPDGAAWRCVTCHPAPDARRAEVPLAGDRLALMQMGRNLGFPRRRLSPWCAILAGAESWHAYATTAPEAAIAALLGEREEQAA